LSPFKPQYNTVKEVIKDFNFEKKPKSGDFFVVGTKHGVTKCSLNTKTARLCCTGKTDSVSVKTLKKCTSEKETGSLLF